jgi:hypothetical protein
MEKFDLSSLAGLGGFDLIKIMELAGEYGPKIRAFVPKIQEMLPQVKEWEKTKSLQPGEIIMYTAIATQTNAYIYVNRVKQNEAGNPELIEQLHRFDLMELVNKALIYIPA